MSKPTIVMVPGAWHQPEIYSGVVASLSKHGYPTISLPLPSAGAMPANPDFNEDVKAIRDCLVELIDTKEKEAILVVHSYTGLPGGEAPKGLSKMEREAKGLKGGLIRYVVIAGFATPGGFQPTTPGDYSQMPPWMKLDEEKQVVTVDPEDAKKVFYNDISNEEAEKWIAKLVPQSLGVYSSKATYAAWEHTPSTFIIAEKDQTTFQPAVIDMMIKGAQQMNPSAFDVVESCPGGHCLMISHPEWTANTLRKAAGEVL